MKICTKCGKELDESLFYCINGDKNNLRTACKDCYKVNANMRNKENKGLVGKKTSESGLSSFTPRQLMEELKSRGYTGELRFVQIIKL